MNSPAPSNSFCNFVLGLLLSTGGSRKLVSNQQTLEAPAHLSLYAVFVHSGREGREFGAATARKKQKTGGLSNREKQKRKRLPPSARAQQLKRRASGKPTGAAAKKAHRGHVGKGSVNGRGAGKKKRGA